MNSRCFLRAQKSQLGPAHGFPEPLLPRSLRPVLTFLAGEVGPAGRRAARPVPGELHQALGGGLLQNRAALPPGGLPPPQAELALSSGSRWGAALLGKAVETKSKQLPTGSLPRAANPPTFALLVPSAMESTPGGRQLLPMSPSPAGSAFHLKSQSAGGLPSPPPGSRPQSRGAQEP